MKKKIFLIVFIVVTVFSNTILAQNIQNKQESKDSIWPKITNTTKPWTRWWWMGNAVDEKNISKELELFRDAGMGGAEVTPIYGVKGQEASFIDFLSPRWVEILKYTISKAKELNLGVDINMGTGWPFGGPEITSKLAAGRLFVKEFAVQGGKKFKGNITLEDTTQQKFNPELIALTAYNEKNKTINLLKNVRKNSDLQWNAPEGNWKVYAAFGGNTGQMVKRAAPGGEGYAMDHLAKKPTQVYLNKFDEAFKHKNIGVRSFFNDSYEVYDANYSPNIFKEFEALKGYDIRNYIKELTSEDNSDKERRIKADYRDVMSNMLLHNFTQPWAQWITNKNALSRNQAHGSPGNIIDLYAAVDIPETEVYGLNKLPLPGINYYSYNDERVAPNKIMIKFATSAAHLLGKPLVSCETFTWLGEHFKVPLSHTKPQVEQTFLTGINHIFYHGTTYSPEEAEWPGWLFYASTNFAPSNSQWPHVKGLNDYITRCQSILQRGKADSDVVVYFPFEDVIYQAPPKLDMQLSIGIVDKWLQPTDFYKEVKNLDNSGYLVDFISDKLIENSTVDSGKIKAGKDGVAYKALIIPQTQFMPVKTFQNILKLAENGANIIFTKLPDDVPGWNNLEERRTQLRGITSSILFENMNGIQLSKRGKGQVLLASNIEEALEYLNISGEKIPQTGLQFIRQVIDGGKYYYLVNHTANPIEKWIPLNTSANSVVILDPQTGKTGLAEMKMENSSPSVRVHLIPGEAIFLQTFQGNAPTSQKWEYYKTVGNSIAVDGPWQLKFTSGGPQLPQEKTLNNLSSWTEINDKDAQKFSGTGVYTTSFNLPSLSAQNYVLDLGDVRESARVWINDQEVAILWSIPYKTNIGPYLKNGKNTLKVEVTNLMANRIIDLDKRGIVWRKFYDINFVNFLYKPFDASKWDWQSSGLLGPVTITPLQEQKNF